MDNNADYPKVIVYNTDNLTQPFSKITDFLYNG
jgi:hypothetical protein